MTTDKKQVTADEIVANLREFTNELHADSKDFMLRFLLEGNIKKFKMANIIHNISHDLMDILEGKSAKEVFDKTPDDDEDNSFSGSIAVNVKTGQIDGIEDITDPKLKEELAEVVQKLADKLGGK
ncbi:hypothetical protein Javan174_0025 [Streptococcus phage Javan174]|uniref:hypothetical protein n=1 Tax=Streptococcus entericus TaxID=155680 RepID=UPI00037C7D57|nr:hypothetical protein [Streptococcus entericus]QBX24091.1 hypothetical protein Javan174_0025 [Streptococcus phage Javan174]